MSVKEANEIWKKLNERKKILAIFGPSAFAPRKPGQPVKVTLRGIPNTKVISPKNFKTELSDTLLRGIAKRRAEQNRAKNFKKMAKVHDRRFVLNKIAKLQQKSRPTKQNVSNMIKLIAALKVTN